MADSIIPTLRRCSKCRELKPTDAFYRRRYAPQYFHSRCIPCVRISSKAHYANAIAAVEAEQLWLQWPNVPKDEYIRVAVYQRARFAREYGLTVAEYFDLYSRQCGLCAICSEPCKDKGLSVDHCHATGEIRGLLCTKCNAGIGALGDTVAGLERAISYLKRSKQVDPNAK